MFSKAAIILVSAFLFLQCSKKADNNVEVKNSLPNIIIIYADDLGYGDVGAYGATKLKTPNIDKLVQGGVQFKNGYATSSTCTPSRFALLTGVYPWRNENAKILPGTAPLLIDTAQITIPKMLQTKGYYTGVIGKWHLGLGSGNANWNEHISPGPNEVGFDYSYIMAATQDRVPTVYIKNGSVVGLDPEDPIEVSYEKNLEGEPTWKDNPALLAMKWHHGHNNSIVNGIPRIGFMKGGENAKWADEDMADTFLDQVQQFIQDHKQEPFFLYYALQQPHVPRTSHSRFVGSSGLGPRGDAIVEADWCIGELIKTLNEAGLLENTLIIVSSDNGPVLNDGYYDDAVEKLNGHTPWGPFRGGKYSLFEAGTHVPFITYWKDHIRPKVSDAIVSQVDLLSSLAHFVNSPIQTEDSENLMDVFLGKSDVGRSELVLEATSRTAFRQGEWVMIPPYGGPAIAEHVNIELGNAKEYQLYNLTNDIGQQHNLADTNMDKLSEMIGAFEKIRGKDNNFIELLELK
jgi:arylsulfatase A-like enzyme